MGLDCLAYVVLVSVAVIGIVQCSVGNVTEHRSPHITEHRSPHVITENDPSLFKFTWKIENFLSLPYRYNEYLSSPPLRSNDSSSGYEWVMLLNPGLVSSSGRFSDDYVRMYLRNSKFPKEVSQTYTWYSVTILGLDGEPVSYPTTVNSGPFVVDKSNYIGDTIQLIDTAKLRRTPAMLPDKHLHLCIKVVTTRKPSHTYVCAPEEGHAFC